jgi:1,4-dihydroxy-2-naphthoate octaprenyltransferase
MPLKTIKKPSTVEIWIAAARPHTLTASVAPTVVGAAITSSLLSSSTCSRSIFLPTVSFATFACLVQLGTNLHNDYADYVKGADTDKRVGHARATQRGWLTPFQTALGATLCLLGATVIGSFLTILWGFDWVMAFVTISSVFNAFAYTGGPYPLGYLGLGHISIGYAGLGDLFVFLYFGVVATVGVPYIYMRDCGYYTSATSLHQQRDELLNASLLSSIPIGLLATAIIVVNNLRDRSTDVTAGKKTLCVRFGEAFGRAEYAFLIGGSYLTLLPLIASFGGPWLLLPLLTIPLATNEINSIVVRRKDGAALNSHVGSTARLQLIFCLLLALGMKISSLQTIT